MTSEAPARIAAADRAARSALYFLAAVGSWTTTALGAAFGDTSGWGAFLLPLIAMVGVGFAVAGVVEFTRQRRFGTPSLEVPQPAHLGDRLAGTMYTDTDVAATGDFRVTVVCQELRPSTGRRRAASEAVTLWTGEQDVDRTTRSSTGLPFAILLDGGGSALPTSQVVSWRIEVRAATKGVDFRASFPVVVAARPGDRPALFATSLDGAG